MPSGGCLYLYRHRTAKADGTSVVLSGRHGFGYIVVKSLLCNDLSLAVRLPSAHVKGDGMLVATLADVAALSKLFMRIAFAPSGSLHSIGSGETVGVRS